MRYVCSLIAVSDMEVSKRFYGEVLGLGVVSDYGANVTLEGGIALQTIDSRKTMIGSDSIVLPTDSGEMYFEEDDMGSFCERLSGMDIVYVHELTEQPWGQRAVRFHDPDGHIIEVGERLEAVVKRFIDDGMTPEDVAGRMDIPIGDVLAYIGR